MTSFSISTAENERRHMQYSGITMLTQVEEGSDLLVELPIGLGESSVSAFIALAKFVGGDPLIREINLTFEKDKVAGDILENGKSKRLSTMIVRPPAKIIFQRSKVGLSEEITVRSA